MWSGFILLGTESCGGFLNTVINCFDRFHSSDIPSVLEEDIHYYLSISECT